MWNEEELPSELPHSESEPPHKVLEFTRARSERERFKSHAFECCLLSYELEPQTIRIVAAGERCEPAESVVIFVACEAGDRIFRPLTRALKLFINRGSPRSQGSHGANTLSRCALNYEPAQQAIRIVAAGE